MRVWDIDPGYLNRQSLLGEHRELHGIVSILVNNKKGYSQHPETLRWVDYGWALRQRHQLLAAEMALRGYRDQSPVSLRANPEQWPNVYIDTPFEQFQLLKSKYEHKQSGRIALPNNAQQVWSQHKYSVLARDTAAYKRLGKEVAEIKPSDDWSGLAMMLTELLRQPPSSGGLKNAIQHMWGYVSDHPPDLKVEVESWPLDKLLKQIQQRALATDQPYLTASTALSELMIWIPSDS
jgi:hypothetical protein